MKVKLQRQTKSDPVSRQVQDRWTPTIAERGWTPVSDYFLRNYHRLRVTHTEAMVLIHLLSFKWDSSAPFPALKTIAKRMGITIASVRTHLRSLEGKKLIARQFRTGTTNRFHLHGLFDALERLMVEDAEAKPNDEDETENPVPRKPR